VNFRRIQKHYLAGRRDLLFTAILKNIDAVLDHAEGKGGVKVWREGKSEVSAIKTVKPTENVGDPIFCSFFFGHPSHSKQLMVVIYIVHVAFENAAIYVFVRLVATDK
jgi:hypothetical protein